MSILLIKTFSDFFFEYGFLTIGLLVTLFSARNSYLEKKEENGLERKSNLRNKHSYRYILFGLILSFVGGVSNNLQQDQNKRDTEITAINNKKTSDSLTKILSNKQNELNEKQNLIIGLQHQQNDTLQNVSSLTQQLNEAQKEVGDLQKQIFNQVEGNQNIPTIFAFGHMKLLDKEHYYINFYISNKSKYPIYGIALRIVDLYEVINSMAKQGEDSIMWKVSKDFDLVDGANKYFDFNVLYGDYRKLFYQSDILVSDTSLIKKMNEDSIIYRYKIYLHWSGKYSCSEEIMLKADESKTYLYTSQITFKLGKKEFIQPFSNPNSIPLHAF